MAIVREEGGVYTIEFTEEDIFLTVVKVRQSSSGRFISRYQL